MNVNRLMQRKIALHTFTIDINGDFEWATYGMGTDATLAYLMGGPL